MTTIFNLRGTFGYGMHGCGYYAGTVHANTFEGFEYWQRNGVKIIEVDISQTTDGEFVALAHKMTPEYLRRLEIRSFDDKDVFTYGWFMRQKLFRYSSRGLHPLDLHRIIDEIRRDNDLIVMFDLYGLWSFEEAKNFTSELNYYIGSDIHLIHQTLIEAYNQNMIDGIQAVKEAGYPIIYCVRDNSTGGNHQWMSPDELAKKGIEFVSYPWHYAGFYEGEMKQYVDNNFTIFSYCADRRKVGECRLGGANVILVDVLFTDHNFFYKYPIYLFGRLKNKIVQKLLRKFFR